MALSNEGLVASFEKGFFHSDQLITIATSYCTIKIPRMKKNLKESANMYIHLWIYAAMYV